MAEVDQSGIVGKIRDRPIGERLRSLLQSAAEATDIDKVYVTSGGQPGSHGRSTGSTRHNNGRAADLQLIRNSATLTFSDSSGGKFAEFIKACAARGASGIGAGIGYMGNRTIHVGYGLSADDHSKLVWGTGGRSASAPQWLRDAARTGWKKSIAEILNASTTECTLGTCAIESGRIRSNCSWRTLFAERTRFGIWNNQQVRCWNKDIRRRVRRT